LAHGIVGDLGAVRGRELTLTGDGLHRRAFLGAATAAAIGTAAGCTADSADSAAGTAGAAKRAPTTASAERDLAGDPWFWVDSAGPVDAIQGYTDRVSVLPGESFTLHASTTGSSYPSPSSTWWAWSSTG